MKVPFVDLRAQYDSIKSEIDEAIEGVIARTEFIRGGQVAQFEAEWARESGSPHCVSCGNGTDAIYIALRSLGVQQGDEVITSAHTWISTSEVISQCGATPVFVDTIPGSNLINPELIEEKITSRTKGIIPVHLYGQMADMAAIMEIGARHGLWILEDCAQAHLATFQGNQVGTMGDVATFSFYPGKNLGAYGDAGCIVTKDAPRADWMRKFADHGGKGSHKIEGINSRLDGLQAAILNVKLPYLQSWTERRQEIADAYDVRLKLVDGVTLPFRHQDRSHVFHLYVIEVDNRDELKADLKTAGVDTVINYPTAVPFLEAYSHRGFKQSDFPVAHAAQSRILSLPIYPEMSLEMVNHVCDLVAKFVTEVEAN